MISIWKFNLALTDAPTHISMPNVAEFCSCGIDPSGCPAIWMKVETTASSEVRQFLIRGTGHEIPPCENYLGTFFDGAFVWHVMETS